MNLETALLLALVGAICGADSFAEQFQIYRPVVVGFLVGLVLGDVKTGLIVGGMFELVFLGQTAAFGGAQPPNMVIGTLMGVTFAIVSKLPPQTAIAVGVPFAVLMQAIMTTFCTLLSWLMHRNDKHIEEGNYKGIEINQYMGLALCAVLYFIVSFIPVYFGADKAAQAIKLLPEWIIHGLGVAGGILPAVGFAMLLKMMFRTEYVVFLILGFFATAYLNLPVLALAIFAFCFVIYDYYLQKSLSKDTTPAETDGI